MNEDTTASGKSCSSRSSRFLILLLMLDFGSFRAFPAAVRLFNSTALTKHSISLGLRIFAIKCQDYLFVAMSRDGLRAHREKKIVAGGSGLIVEESARLTFPNRSAVPEGVRRAAMGSALSRARTWFYQISIAECVQN